MSMIQRLKELEAKGTPGEWYWLTEYGAPCIYGPKGKRGTKNQIVPFVEGSDNAELITEMRNALPKLLAVVEACKKSRDECHASCASWHGDDCDCGYIERCEALTALNEVPG